MMLARVTGDIILKNLLLVDSLHELPDNKGHTLYSFDLLLGSNEFSLKAPAFVSGAGSLWSEKQFSYLCSSLMYSSCRLMYLEID